MHKGHPVIAAGLNEHCTLMNMDAFQRIRKSTNAVEQTHYKSNSMGRRLSILKAIQM